MIYQYYLVSVISDVSPNVILFEVFHGVIEPLSSGPSRLLFTDTAIRIIFLEILFSSFLMMCQYQTLRVLFFSKMLPLGILWHDSVADPC